VITFLALIGTSLTDPIKLLVGVAFGVLASTAPTPRSRLIAGVAASVATLALWLAIDIIDRRMLGPGHQMPAQVVIAQLIAALVVLGFVMALLARRRVRGRTGA
jgi:hypothetical protein